MINSHFHTYTQDNEVKMKKSNFKWSYILAAILSIGVGIGSFVFIQNFFDDSKAEIETGTH